MVIFSGDHLLLPVPKGKSTARERTFRGLGPGREAYLWDWRGNRSGRPQSRVCAAVRFEPLPHRFQAGGLDGHVRDVGCCKSVTDCHAAGADKRAAPIG